MTLSGLYVFMVRRSDGWGHSHLVHVAGSFAKACEWVANNGGSKTDAAMVATYRINTTGEDDLTAIRCASIAVAGSRPGSFDITWAPIDGVYIAP